MNQRPGLLLPPMPPALAQARGNPSGFRNALSVYAGGVPEHMRDPTPADDTGYQTGDLWRGPSGWFSKAPRYGTTNGHWMPTGPANALAGSINTSTLAVVYALMQVVPGYAGPLFDIARQDGTTVAIQQLQGKPDLMAIASHVGHGVPWPTKFYDQTGGGNHATQTNIAKCPRLDMGRITNGVPALYFDSNYMNYLCTQIIYTVTNVGAVITLPAVTPGVVIGTPVSAANMPGNVVTGVATTNFTVRDALPNAQLGDVQFSEEYRQPGAMALPTFNCRESYNTAVVFGGNTITLLPHLPWWMVPGIPVAGTNIQAGSVIQSADLTNGAVTLDKVPTGPVTSLTLAGVNKYLDMPAGLSLNARNFTAMALMRRTIATISSKAFTFGAASDTTYSATAHVNSLSFVGSSTQNVRWLTSSESTPVSLTPGALAPDTVYDQERHVWAFGRSGTTDVVWTSVSGNTITVTPNTYKTSSTQTGIATGAACTNSGLPDGTTGTVNTSGGFVTTIVLSNPPVGSSGVVTMGNAAQCDWDFADRSGRTLNSLPATCPAVLTGGTIGYNPQSLALSNIQGDFEFTALVAWNAKLPKAQYAAAKIALLEGAGCRPQIKKAIGFVGSSITAGNGTIGCYGPPSTLIEMVHSRMPRRWFNVSTAGTIEHMLGDFDTWCLPVINNFGVRTWVVQPGFGNTMQVNQNLTVGTGGSAGRVVPISSPGSFVNTEIYVRAMLKHANIVPGTYIESINGLNITLSADPSASIAAGQTINVINDSAAHAWASLKLYLAKFRAAGVNQLYVLGHMTRGTFLPATTAPGATGSQEDEFFKMYDLIDQHWADTEPVSGRPYMDGWFNATKLGGMNGLRMASVPPPWGQYPMLYNPDMQHPQIAGSRFQYAPVAAALLATA